MHRPVDADVGDVPAEGGRPTPDLGDVEHDVVAVHLVVQLAGVDGRAGAHHQHRARDVEAVVHLGVGVADRPQPPGVHGPRLERLELEVVVPLAGVVAVQALAVDRRDLARDLAHRLAAAEPADHRGARGAQPDRATHVEPRGVEGDALEVRRALVGPQRQGQAAGRVRGGDDVVVAVALGDPAPRGVDVVEVLADVGDEVGRLPLAHAAAVAAQVDRVEVVAAGDPPVGVLLVEEVVVEPVDVQHRLAGRLARPAAGPAW